MKGVVNTLEAVIGVVIILGVMIFLFTFQPVQEQNMYDMSYKCLKYAKDFNNVEEAFDDCFPSTYEFQIRTCYTAQCKSLGALPVNATITSAEYIDSGPRLIKVWVYR